MQTDTHRAQGPKSLVVALDSHFTMHDRNFYTELAFGDEYWSQYLSVFARVFVLARVRPANSLQKGMRKANGDRIEFIPLPDFVGPKGVLRVAFPLVRQCWRASRLRAAFLLRNGTIGTIVWLLLRLRGRPYAREVQGHLLESISLWKGGSPSPPPRRFVKLLARLSERLAKRQAYGAYAVSYVSEHARRTYPAKDPSREFVFSSVDIEGAYSTGPRPRESFEGGLLRLLSVGRLEYEKGHHVLLDALAQLSAAKPELHWKLSIIGPGSRRMQLDTQASRLGLAPRVEFLGTQSRSNISTRIDNADLFILPSLTEGLPRALVEAMARGLPAIGSAVGGVPDLLPHDRLVTPGDPSSLADAIWRIGTNSRYLEEISRHDFETVNRNYSPDALQPHRQAFIARIGEIA